MSLFQIKFKNANVYKQTLNLVLTIIFITHSGFSSAFELDLKKLKNVVDQIKSQPSTTQNNNQKTESQSDQTPVSTNDISNNAQPQRGAGRGRGFNPSSILTETSYDPTQQFEIKDSESYCNKLTSSEVVKKIINFNKPKNVAPTDYQDAQPSAPGSSVNLRADWYKLVGQQGELGIYLWQKIKINENSTNADKQFESNSEIIDKWVSSCIAKNLNTDLNYFTGVSKSNYQEEAYKQGVISQEKTVNNDGTVTTNTKTNSNKYVQLNKFWAINKDSFLSENIDRQNPEFLVYLAFAMIKDPDTFLSNSGKQYLAYIKEKTDYEAEAARKYQEDKAATQKIANEFMKNPPQDALANSCWMYSGIPDTPSTAKWVESLSTIDKMALIGSNDGTMITFKPNGVAWFGKDAIKLMTCSSKQNKLQGKINCAKGSLDYKFNSYDVLYTKDPKDSTWTSAYKRGRFCL